MPLPEAPLDVIITIGEIDHPMVTDAAAWIAAALWKAGSREPWLRRATEWCWATLKRPDELSGYLLKFALAFLDQVPEPARADGGWTFDWLGWSPGQSVEWRGLVTLQALETLTAHGRITLPRAV
ncbi:hypothetical protein [Parafrankia discariae]|uniref:hypothetical protein n=1 Tax=Parafrankia discariae TaxID=365528 RepID=UPI0018A7EE72|nr:hypothetical protein [Parafrankia discariae]